MSLNKSARKKIWIGIGSLLLLLFACYQIYLMNYNSTSTQPAITATAYESIKTQAVFFREEKLLDDVQGHIVASTSDGGKISGGGVVAKVFDDENAAHDYTTSLSLQKELDYYNSLKSQSLGIATDIESMDKSITEEINNLVRTKNSGDLSMNKEYEESVNDLLIRRDLLIGNEIDFTGIISETQVKIDELSKTAKETSSVISDVSGNFSTRYDGYEDYFDCSRVADFTVDEVNKYISETTEKKDVSAMGKIITGFNWYVACVTDSTNVAGLNIGDVVSVAVSSNSNLVIDATVYAKNTENATAEKTALILKADIMNPEISGLRNEEIEVRLKEFTGLRVDSRGIVVDGDKTGVYVLVSNKVVYRKIERIYSSDGFVIAKLDNSDNENIKLYDNVIVGGKDLFDGKFIN